VLREVKGWDPSPYQWATSGYMGAISSGRTICGILFGAVVYLGYLNGIDETGAPAVNDDKRKAAIKSVENLFVGFDKRFGHTDCRTLTGCDWSKQEDIKRYRQEQIYKDTCYPQFEYVLEKCLNQ
jgi:hypothetical protein